MTDSDTKVVMIAQATMNAATGDIVLTAHTGATVTSVGGFSYIAVAIVSDALLALGQIGT